MQNLSCFISPEYHPIQNRINLFFLGIRVKKLINDKRKTLEWSSIVSKALFYLFLSLFLIHLARTVFFRKPKIKTSFLTPINSAIVNDASAETQLKKDDENDIATSEANLISENELEQANDNISQQEIKPSSTPIPEPTSTPSPTPKPTTIPTPKPTQAHENVSQQTDTNFIQENSNKNKSYNDSILGWSFSYDKNLNPSFIKEDNQIKIEFNKNIILIRPININNPHSYINNLATKNPTQKELKKKSEDQNYRNWINQSLDLMRSKFVKFTKNGEISGLVRREHVEKNSTEIYPNLTMVKTINDQNYEFVFYNNKSWPSLDNQEYFYQIFFSFKSN
jgi:hypothetical protein